MVGLLAMLLLAGLFGCAKAGGTDAEAFDFSELSGDGLPLGWTVVSYENQYAADCSDGVVTLQSDVADDCRLVHTVAVSGGTKYVLSADIATTDVFGGEGATLSIDNYSFDGSYIYSQGLFGTNDWRHIELAFETDKKQDEVQLALRLGGYSSVASGTVRFRNVVFEQKDVASVGFQRLVMRSDSGESKTEKSNTEYEAFFSLLFWLTVLAAAALLFGVYRNRERLEAEPMEERTRKVLFGLIVLIGFVIRLFLCKVFKGHATDMGCWVSWGNQIADGGFASFYDGTWYDYPPGYMLVLGALTRIMRLLRVSEWGSETLRLFWYMLPAFLCDIGCGILLMRFAKEQNRSDAEALLLGSLIVLNPAAMYLSGAWGQIDSVLTLLLLLAFEAFRKDRRILCGVWYALAILVKWQALIYGPVLAMVYLCTLATDRDRSRRTKNLWKTVAAVALAVGIILLVSLPFRGTMGVFWIVERFLSASSGYDYATVEGYNFFALLGANWRNANVDLFNGAGVGSALLLTLNTLGKLLVPIGVTVLGIASVHEFRSGRGYAAPVSFGAVLLLGIIIRIVTFAAPEMENAAWMLYGIAALIGLIGWYAQRMEQTRSLKTILETDETAYYGLVTTVLGAGAVLGTFVLWLLCRLVGIALTYKVFGSVMIGLSAAAAGWMLWRYHKADRLHSEEPELLVLVSACFMLWVFTFGQYMHERYVFPVLIFLLFAYAASKNRRILLCALLLTVSTFLNELVAMYVVSDGAIHAIRGGDTHNRFLAACSMIEVTSALYLTGVVHRHLMEKGGKNA